MNKKIKEYISKYSNIPDILQDRLIYLLDKLNIKITDLGYYQNRIIENMRKYAPDIKIHFSSCDDIAFYGGCFNCISNFKYR